jgi:serine/threonine protein kinase
MLRGEHGSQADVWSLGATLYFLLCGHPPVTGFREDVIRSTLSKNVTFHGPQASALSEDCKHLIAMLLQKNPVMRPTLTEIAGKSRLLFAVMTLLAVQYGPLVGGSPSLANGWI